MQQEYEDTLVNPYIAAERGYVDAVIPPSHTRGYIGDGAAPAGAQDRPGAAEEAREHSPVSRVSDDERTSATVRDETAAAQPHEPHIQVLKGNPTDEELAALITVLGSAGGGGAAPAAGGQPVGPAGRQTALLDLQLAALTLVQRTHMRCE